MHGLVWTVLPSLIYFNLPLDVIEAMVYGREWQLGYDKLPPLPWWLAEAVYRVFGSDDSLYALSQIAVIIAFVAVWKTARPLVGASRRARRDPDHRRHALLHRQRHQVES